MKRYETSMGSLPETTGVGLRGPHIGEVLATRPAIGWFEVHSENYMAKDDAGFGPALRQLGDIRRDYPVSLHSVGLSPGSAEGPDPIHIARLRDLAERIEPVLVSDHLAWSVSGGVYLNDLLPLPYTEESLNVVRANVSKMQEGLGRQMLIENPSAYLRFRHSPIPEPEFLVELARRTGCAILCDVNNVHVTCTNFGLDPEAYLDALPASIIGEIHLAGHARVDRDGRTLLIDDHGSRVAPQVWMLYRKALARFGSVPTLIEWDKNLPDLDTLIEEARSADRYRLADAREIRRVQFA